MNPSQTLQQEDKLSVLRKYEKYVTKDGRAILFTIKSCRGEEVDCPNLLNAPRPLARKITEKLDELSFNQRLFDKIPVRILPHMTFKMAVAGCPNACSMPQIKDFGVIAQESVVVDTGCECNLCRKCLKACREGAITLNEDRTVIIDQEKCVDCGLCARVCPTGSIKIDRVGYAIVLGGKVGRHPRFATKLVDLATEKQVLRALEICAKRILAEKRRNRYGFLTKASFRRELREALEEVA